MKFLGFYLFICDFQIRAHTFNYNDPASVEILVLNSDLQLRAHTLNFDSLRPAALQLRALPAALQLRAHAAVLRPGSRTVGFCSWPSPP